MAAQCCGSMGTVNPSLMDRMPLLETRMQWKPDFKSIYLVSNASYTKQLWV